MCVQKENVYAKKHIINSREHDSIDKDNTLLYVKVGIRTKYVKWTGSAQPVRPDCINGSVRLRPIYN